MTTPITCFLIINLFLLGESSSGDLFDNKHHFFQLEFQDSLKMESDTILAWQFYKNGVGYKNSGEYSKAIESLERSLDLFSGIMEPPNHSRARVLRYLGEIHGIMASFDTSYYYHRAALEINKKIRDGFSLNLAADYYSYGTTKLREGKYVEAIDFYSKALQILEDKDALEHRMLAGLYNNSGIAYKNLGEYDKALDYYGLALERKINTLGREHINTANTYINMSSVALQKGEFDLALEYCQEALSILRLIHKSGHPNEALVLGNIGIIWKEKGDYNKAIEYGLATLRVRAKQFGMNHLSVSNSYNNLGLAYFEKGDLDQALESFEKSLNIRIHTFGESHSRVAEVYNNMGMCYMNLEDYKLAIGSFEKSIKIKENTSQTNPELFSGYYNLGNAYLELGNFNMAMWYFLRSQSILDTNYHPRNCKYSIVYHGMAKVSLANGDDSCARHYFMKSLGSQSFNLRNPLSFEGICNYNGFGSTMLDLADFYKLYYRHGQDSNYLDSIEFIYDALIGFDDFIRRELQAGKSREHYAHSHLPVYERLIEFLHIVDNMKNGKKGWYISERFKGRGLSESLAMESVIKYKDYPVDILSRENEMNRRLIDLDTDIQEWSNSTGLNSDSSLAGLQSERFDLSRKRDKFLDSIKNNYPNYYSRRYEYEVVSLDSIQNVLKLNRSSLMEYFVGDSSIFTFTILPDTFYVHQIKKDFPLDSWVEEMLHGIYDPFTPGTDTVKREYSFQEAASLIYNKVFHHVDTLLPEGTDIILVPDGILGYIPFDALLTDSTDSESYLIRDHQISYAYSATLQAEMKNMQHDHQAQKKILAFAPSFDHFETTGDTNALASRFIDVSNTRNWLGPLKYNDDEVRTISQMVPTDVFIDSTATKDRFLQNASDYSIIHLSTHGKANDKMGDYSFLAFYDPQDSSETWLYNRELYGLDLNADMVVLSACETGIGELQRGEGIISLARGFSYAGAKSIITTLWSVNDRSTQKVMELFYEKLANGMPKDAALRQAKLDYLDQYPHLGKSPYFWAGIIPIGDMSPISFQTPWYQNPLYLLGGLFFLTLGIWASRKLF